MDHLLSMALKHLPKGQTVLIVITDGLEPIAQWEAFIQRLPRYAGDVRMHSNCDARGNVSDILREILSFIDVETDEKLNISMSNQIIEQYITKKRVKHEKKFQLLCAKYWYGNNSTCCRRWHFSNAFFHRLKKSNWIYVR